MKHVWIFDSNHRIYHDDEGKPTAYCNYRYHWVKWQITGETSRSYIAANYKIPKKNPDKRCFLFKEEDVEKDVWVHRNRQKICERIRAIRDYDILKKVEEILGGSLA